VAVVALFLPSPFRCENLHRDEHGQSESLDLYLTGWTLLTAHSELASKLPVQSKSFVGSALFVEVPRGRVRGAPVSIGAIGVGATELHRASVALLGWT
jgi:hypothetical protein